MTNMSSSYTTLLSNLKQIRTQRHSFHVWTTAHTWKLLGRQIARHKLYAIPDISRWRNIR